MNARGYRRGRSISLLGAVLSMLHLLLAGVVDVRAQWEDQPRAQLIAQLDTSTHDLQQARSLLALAGSWFVSEKGMPYLQRLGPLLDKLDHDPDPAVREEARSMRLQYLYLLGYKMKFKRRSPEALRIFQQIADTMEARRDTSGLVGTLDAIATMYRALGEPAVAFRIYNEALGLKLKCTSAPVHNSEGSIRIHMAQCLREQGRSRDALDMLQGVDTTAAEDHANLL